MHGLPAATALSTAPGQYRLAGKKVRSLISNVQWVRVLIYDAARAEVDVAQFWSYPFDDPADRLPCLTHQSEHGRFAHSSP